MILAIANNDRDSLEKIDPEKVAIRKLWKERIQDVLKVLLIGVAPIGGLWLIQNSSLAMGKPISDYAIAAVLLWAI